jgi:pimeloyl-ACP methyl ester carboxylesterase
MTLRRLILSAALFSAVITLHAQSAIDQDPAPDKANPAALQSFQLSSHGALLNALVYVASGAGPHPVVILLHGFPGNEKNLDIAQTLRRAGYDVLFFNYRGSWGSPGDFSFTHGVEDVDAAIDYIRNPVNAVTLRADPTRIIIAGHSMGGMFSAILGAEHSNDPWLKAVILISAANMAGRTLPAVQAHQQDAALPQIAKALAANGLAPLAGCTAESLAKDLFANATAWNIPDLAPALAKHPIVVISSDDGNTATTDILLANLTKLGDTQVKAIHIPTDHSYSDHRIALQKSILDSLTQLNIK